MARKAVKKTTKKTIERKKTAKKQSQDVKRPKKTVKYTKEIKLPIRITEQIHPSQGYGGQREKKEVKIENKPKKEVKRKVDQPIEKKIKQTPQPRKPIIYEKEKSKKTILWLGVTTVMILIFIGWVFNLGDIFETEEQKNINSAVKEWDKIADDFNKTLEKVKQEMANLKENIVIEGNQNRDIFSETATSTREDDTYEIEELKKKIEELEGKINDKQATTTPDNLFLKPEF